MWLTRHGTKVVCRKVCDFEIRNQNNTQGLCRKILRFQRKPKSRITHKEKNVIVWYTEKRKEGRIRWPRNTVKTLWDCWNAAQRKKRKRFDA